MAMGWFFYPVAFCSLFFPHIHSSSIDPALKLTGFTRITFCHAVRLVCGAGGLIHVTSIDERLSGVYDHSSVELWKKVGINGESCG